VDRGIADRDASGGPGRAAADHLIRLALAEDMPGGDVTTEAVGGGDRGGAGVIVAEEEMFLSGLEVARRVFEILDPEVAWKSAVSDGERVSAATVLARLQGKSASLLAGERTALNFLQRLSGVATLTSRFVAKVEGMPARILDTRKTTPGWRLLEKEAVRHGGGSNHRFNLSDGILIKDNHIELAGSLTLAVTRARDAAPPGMKVEVEASNLEEVREAVRAGADTVLVDNTSPEELSEALKAVGEKAEVEVSGGITEENVHAMAATGVAMISVGALTHSARAMDISMDFFASGSRGA
jgi:nicotinate-nucleotide pyrophosphorylase (carboxylating)